MTNEEKEKSYERYKQWQYNKARYRSESTAFAIIFIAVILFFLFNFKIAIIVSICILGGVYLWDQYEKSSRNQKLREIMKECGMDVNTTDANGKFSAVISKDQADEMIARLNKKAQEEGININIRQEPILEKGLENKFHSQKEAVIDIPKKQNGTASLNSQIHSEKKKRGTSTTLGYVNRNNQRNNGRTDLRGTDHGQWLYDMECLNCGHQYHANGTDIWQRKCPHCQGGAK